MIPLARGGQLRDPPTATPPVPERSLALGRPSPPLIPTPPPHQTQIRRLRDRQLGPRRRPLGPSRPRRRQVASPSGLELDHQLDRTPRGHHSRRVESRMEVVDPRGWQGQGEVDARRTQTRRDRVAGSEIQVVLIEAMCLSLSLSGRVASSLNDPPPTLYTSLCSLL